MAAERGMEIVGTTKIKAARQYLGDAYRIEISDGVESICRTINERFEFEICGFFSSGGYTVNLWQYSPHRELLAVYSGIRSLEDLRDTLGYLAFKYQNLSDRIQVEREDSPR